MRVFLSAYFFFFFNDPSCHRVYTVRHGDFNNTSNPPVIVVVVFTIIILVIMGQ